MGTFIDDAIYNYLNTDGSSANDPRDRNGITRYGQPAAVTLDIDDTCDVAHAHERAALEERLRQAVGDSEHAVFLIDSSSRRVVDGNAAAHGNRRSRIEVCAAEIRRVGNAA